MNTQLDLQTKFVEWMENAANTIHNFAQEQIPPFIEEFLTWKFFENAVDIGFYFMKFLLFLGIAFTIYRIGAKNLKNAKALCQLMSRKLTDEEELSAFAPMVVGAITGLIVMIVGACALPTESIKNMIKIKTAPKVFLIEEAARIINSNKNQ